MAATTDFQIGIWGVARAGKTTYLAMLYHTLLGSDEWFVECDAAAHEFVKSAHNALFGQGRFPEKTVEVVTYCYTLIDRLDPTRRYILRFVDAPGELYENYYDKLKREIKPDVGQQSTEPLPANMTPNELLDVLKGCSALVVFLDPDWEDETKSNPRYMNLLSDLLRDLGRETVLALCVSKVDGKQEYWNRRLMADKQCYRAHSVHTCNEQCNVYHLLKAPFMETQLKGLVSDLRNVECFSLSSVGRTPTGALNVTSARPWSRPITQGRIRVLSSYKPADLRISDALPAHETLLPRALSDKDAINPFELLAPIEWAIERLEQP